MSPILRNLTISTGVAFVILAVMAATPLAFIPILLSTATFGWAGIALFLLASGAPFGGLVFTLIVSPPEKRAISVAGLCGAWIGAIAGSTFGIKIFGAV